MVQGISSTNSSALTSMVNISSIGTNFAAILTQAESGTSAMSSSSDGLSSSSSSSEPSTAELSKALKGFTTCSKCGAMYMGQNPPQICARCGNEMSSDSNDNSKVSDSNTETSISDNSVKLSSPSDKGISFENIAESVSSGLN